MSDFNDAKLILTPNGYKAGKAYSLKPFDGSGDFTVVRNTTATTRNENGLIKTALANEPRLNYPIGGGCPSWLIEGQSTNLVTYSEDFSQWGEINATTTSNSATSPSGLLNADKVIASNSNSTHAIFIIPSVSASTTYTFSLYAKADEYERIYIRQGTGGNPCAAVYELSGSGSVLETYSSPIDTSINNVGNGWYRITLTNTTSPTAPNFAPNVIGIPNSGYSASDANVSFQGDGTSGIYIWGAQLEQGDLTSYIPTNGSAVTRNADVFSKTGISSLIGQTEGTVFFHGSFIANKDCRIGLTNTNNSDQVIFGNSLGLFFRIVNNNSNIITEFTGESVTENSKIALKYKSGETSIFLNGIKVGSSQTNFSLSGLNTFTFQAQNQLFSGKINKLLLFDTALSDTQLQEITTI